MSDITKTVCRFAWDYPVLNISRNELRFCCRAKQNVVDSSEFNAKGADIFTGFIPIIDVRKELLRGHRHENCQVCWDIEDSGSKSPRTSFDNFVGWVHVSKVWPGLTKAQVHERLLNLTEEQIEDLIKIDKTRMIEISLSNTCDLKCMYCNHHYSSQWATEKLKYKEIKIEEVEKELPKVDTIYEDVFWKWFETNSGAKTNAINFIGGEPLIIDKFYSYLDRIIKFYETTPITNEFIDIAVVSNFNTPSKLYQKFLTQTLDIVASEKLKLDINISCESIGKKAEFIRTGTDWQLMDSNIKNFLKHADIFDVNQSKIIFNFQIALNALCISDLPNFFKYVIDLQKNYKRKIHLRQNQVADPQWLNPSILTPDFARYIDESIDILEAEIANTNQSTYTNFGRWDSYVTFLKAVRKGILNPNKNIQAQQDFVTNIDKLSSRRKLNFHSTFPEMVEFYDMCKTI